MLSLKHLAIKAVIEKKLGTLELPKTLQEEIVMIEKRKQLERIWKFFDDRYVHSGTPENFKDCCEVLGYTKNTNGLIKNIYLRLRSYNICKRLGFQDAWECVNCGEMDEMDKESVMEYDYDPEENVRDTSADPNLDLKIKDIPGECFWIKVYAVGAD